MKYFKVITRIEQYDIEGKHGEGDYWQNSVNISDINECQQRGLLKAFKPLVEENGDLLLDIARRAL